MEIDNHILGIIVYFWRPP